MQHCCEKCLVKQWCWLLFTLRIPSLSWINLDKENSLKAYACGLSSKDCLQLSCRYSLSMCWCALSPILNLSLFNSKVLCWGAVLAMFCPYMLLLEVERQQDSLLYHRVWQKGKFILISNDRIYVRVNYIFQRTSGTAKQSLLHNWSIL